MGIRSSVGIAVFALALGFAWPGMAQESALAMRGPRFLAVPRGGGAPVDASDAAVLRRRVSLSLTRASVEAALQEIARQTGLELMYSSSILPSGRTVTLQAADITMAAALTEVLLDSGLDVVLLRTGQMGLVRRSTGQVFARAIVGRVIDAKTREGIGAAEISLAGTKWKTATDSAGRYRLPEVDQGTYSMTARRLGYKRLDQKVTVHAEQDDTIDVALEPVALPLDELVTTATGPQRRRDIGNAVTTIKADSVLRTAPIRNLTDMLQNRVPGMTLQHTSGAPGDPARIRLRGLGSVLRSNDPVVVVDGVRVYAAQSEARSGNLTNLIDAQTADPSRTPAPSPLDQIDPNIIEKVEVFKGPSAATLYGADAANGVIVITTKRGKPGPTRWAANFEHGLTRTLGHYPTGYYRWGHDALLGRRSFCAITQLRCIQDSLVQFQALNLPSLTVLGQGHRTAMSLTASGGTQGLTYSVTGTYGKEFGLLRLPTFEVERFRTNFNREAPDWMRRPHELTDWSVTSNVRAVLGRTADVTLATSLGRNQQQRSSLENQLASLAGTYIDTINKVYYRSQPFSASDGPIAATSTILQDYYVRTTESAINFTTSLTSTWRPLPWINASGQAGVNVISRDDQRLLPPGLASPTDKGSFSRGTGQSLVGTFNLQGGLRRPLGWGFAFVANLGANVNTVTTGDLVASDSAGLRPGSSTISGFGQVSESRVSSSVFGWYLEPQITGQRLSLSTGLRLDGGSAYGARVSGLGGGPGRGFLRGLLALPKLNGSWVISEEPWFPFQSLFSSLRLRGAYGQAQVQPGPADRLRLYRYSTPIDASVTLSTLGNTQLRPERSTEFEGGFDADLFDSRFSVELTGYRKTQVDALMSMKLPESVNGGGDVLTNIGTIRNTGFNVTLRLVPVRSPTLTWSSELTYASNRNELVELGRGVQTNRVQGIVAGYPLGSRWDRPVLGYNDIDGNGVLQTGEVLVGDSAVYMGQLYPAYQMTLHSGITLLNGAVGITAGFSYDAGASQLNEPAKTNWVLSRALVDPATPLQQQAAALASSWGYTNYGLIQEVSTFRFNSLSVNYRAPTAVTRLVRAQQLMIALQGSNLALHSTYRGKDPDVNAWGPGERIVDGGQLAQPTTWQLRIDLQY